MKQIALITGLGLLTLLGSCAKEKPDYAIDFQTTVTVHACDSVQFDVSISSTESSNFGHTGILWGECENVTLSYQYNADCYGSTYSRLAPNQALNFTVFSKGPSGYDWDPYQSGQLYYVRPFVVIENSAYYGESMSFGC